ncbi:MAG: glutathione-disulfide reductase [Oligoflexus sp.]
MTETLEKNFDLIVIGGGSGGIATANRAASYGAKVLLIEKHRLGGTCVNVGCVPKKVMWNAANLIESFHLAEDYGLKTSGIEKDWRYLTAARDAYVLRLNGIYAKNLQKNGVLVKQGVASLVDANTVQVGDEQFQGKHILLATGGKPRRPNIPGAEIGIDSDGFFQLREQPKKVAVIGTGYIGVELSGILASYGSELSLFSKDERILRHFDRSMSNALEEEMAKQGIQIVLKMEMNSIERDADGKISFTDQKHTKYSGFDELIWTIGREPLLDFGLDKVGVKLDEWGYIKVDEWQETSIPGIFALGDVTGKMPLTPVAIAAGRRLADRLFGGKKDAKLDYENVPSVVFSHPPISSIGLSEDDAKEQYGEKQIKCYEARFTNMLFALSERKQATVMKLVTLLPEEKVIGLHAFGQAADELIQGFAVAIRMGATKADFDRTVAVHPTAAEELVLLR